MEDVFGQAFSLVGAAIFYSLAAYVLTRKSRDISHYLFSFLMLMLGTSEFLAFLEFSLSKEIAYILLKFDLSCVALGIYSFLLFADYLLEGLNFKFAILAFIPTASIIAMVFTFLVEGMTMGPYGWVGVYNLFGYVIYAIYSLMYLGATLLIFSYIHRTVEGVEMKRKTGILIIAILVVAVGGLLNLIVILTVGRVFPIMEVSIMLFGVIATIPFRGKY